MTSFIDPYLLLETDEQDVVAIDVRNPAEYAAGHVPGAVNIPIDELVKRQSELEKYKLIVPYCNMFHPGNSRGEKATVLLNNLGFEAKVLQVGFKEWQAAGLPIGVKNDEA